MTDFKDVYVEGIEVGRALGRKEGLAEALQILILANEHTASNVVAKHYDRLLAEERARADRPAP